MELRHLRYFVAVGQALNFTKAAMRLHLAQPALSRQVSDLEGELGVDLLKRTSHGVVLTPEGKLFLEAARGILERVDDSVTKSAPWRVESLMNCKSAICRHWICTYFPVQSRNFKNPRRV